MRRLGRTSASAATALAVGIAAVLLAPAPAAVAATTSITDRVGDSTRVDVTRVSVGYDDGAGLRVRVTTRGLRATNQYTLWFDTSSAAGPEYRLSFRPNSQGPRLERVSSWGGAGSVRDCPSLRASADAFGGSVVTVSMATRCVGTPASVRVATRFVDGASTDWAPTSFEFGPRTRRN